MINSVKSFLTHGPLKSESLLNVILIRISLTESEAETR